MTAAEPTRPAAAITAVDVFGLYPIPAGPTVAALRGLSLDVAGRERLVVHGPNGSGKTTLLRMLSGELAPSSGALTVAGVDLSAGDPRAATRLRRDVLGLVAQNSGRALRPELDVLDNVGLQLRIAGASRRAARARAAELLGELGLAHLATRRPAGLSGGEAQRVSVCAAVAHAPALLLADEPTGELDAEAADSVYDLIAASVEHVGATLVLVTHDARAARIGDRVVRIRDGRLSEQWDPQQPDDEQLVLDPAGWLRLPESLRQGNGMRRTARVAVEAGTLVLRGTDDGADEPARTLSLPPVAEPLDPDSPAARLQAVSLRFGDRVVLDGLEVAVAPGALTVLRGRSGSGKSTLLGVLLGLLDPDAGGAELGGVGLKALGRAARAGLRRRLVGVALQSGALVETADARENLAIARRSRGLPGPGRGGDEVVDALLDALDLTAVVRRPARLLSGGERQRVAIARSLAVQRPIVVLDEPTSQQDELHAARVAGVLAAAAAAGSTIVCATHDELVAGAAGALIDLGGAGAAGLSREP